MTIRIMLADDHAVFRNGLRALLKKRQSFMSSLKQGMAMKRLKRHAVKLLMCSFLISICRE